MDYYFKTTFKGDFNQSIDKVKDALKTEGFGVLTEIDIKKTMKEKLDADFNNYMILGACNPPFAHEALKAENKIGTMLPCNVIVQEINDGLIEVAAVNPQASMQAVKNEKLESIASEITTKLQRVLKQL